ncbi:MAG TPA: NADH-quinone oxidoreductase subunit I [Caldisericia bacterium]|nr:NADH-quinone oxidoreductase subunit I [Caldisericia bacterium]HPF49045.1 NADH-quinone oxidoreductase subunit I [Caldisericia bacterium]HPI83091.1 NADH-quinone oxidoreductase subunit I [Caldisericia bacterium]HPQ92318.1 NADH-quinone oxidoreductase subunit I [Caldisericia bacterium]HRV74584.1 NADH-quinone oxidoreductase subunit I [Caldisericia bacterium]
MYGKGIAENLWVTFKHIFRKKITLRYPKKKQPMEPRFFGLMRLVRDENGKEKCTACGICANNCPVHAITIVKGKNEEGKPFAQEYDVNIQQCMFCGICVESCPFGALVTGNFFELASFSREGMLYKKEELLNSSGGDA